MGTHINTPEKPKAYTFYELDEGVMYRLYNEQYETTYMRSGKNLIWFETSQNPDDDMLNFRVGTRLDSNNIFQVAPHGTTITITLEQ